MLSFYSRLSPAQQLVLSGVASLVGTALVVTLAATYQLYTEQGQLNIGVLLNFAIATFAVLISKSLHDYVPSHVQVELQAVRDSESQAHDALARSQSITQTVINKNATAPSQTQNGPLLVVHTPQLNMTTLDPPQVSMFNPAPVAPVAPPDVSTLATASVPVPQLPFPDVPTQRIDIPAQNTMPEIPAMTMPLHFGDSGLVPTVVAP